MAAVLFDLDGTLLDTLEDLRDGVNYALEQFGYEKRELEHIRKALGNGARKLIEGNVPQGADVDAVLVVYQAYYKDHCRIKTDLYPGIREAIAELGKKYSIAVVSNKPDSATKALCADYFPGVYALGEAPGCPRKPAPDMLHKALEALGENICVYIGDSEVDVVTAKNAGCPCISVTWGFRDEDELVAAGAAHICHSAYDLPGMIEEVLGYGK